jgi:glycosyltransferase involved in cell wall biosynthesis
LPAIDGRAIEVIVPSLTDEVFNQVIAEALARGTPVIARNPGPRAEIVAEAGGGLVYRDDVELTGHLQTLLSHPDQRDVSRTEAHTP